MTEYNDQITFKISDERLQWIDDQVELETINQELESEDGGLF